MATTEDKATFIYLVQQWVQTTGINLGFYWTSKIPEAATPEDAIIGIKNESFIPETEDEIKNGWFSFIMDNFRNKKNEPFVFSFNSKRSMKRVRHMFFSFQRRIVDQPKLLH